MPVVPLLPATDLSAEPSPEILRRLWVHRALERRDTDLLKHALSPDWTPPPAGDGALPDANEPTVLELAVSARWPEGVRIALQTPLDDGALTDAMNTVSFLFDAPGVHWDERGDREVVSEGDAAAQREILEILLEAGGDPNAVDAYGDSTLYWAASHGMRHTVERLLDAGAHPYRSSPDTTGRVGSPRGWSALFGAIESGRQDVVELLLARGADPGRERESDGLTPEAFAVECGHLPLARLLRDAHAARHPETPETGVHVLSPDPACNLAAPRTTPARLEQVDAALRWSEAGLPDRVDALDVDTAELDALHQAWRRAIQPVAPDAFRTLKSDGFRAAGVAGARLSAMPVFAYGPRLEAAWGDGAWTDGLHVWVAASTLAALRQERLKNPRGTVVGPGGTNLARLLLSVAARLNEREHPPLAARVADAGTERLRWHRDHADLHEAHWLRPSRSWSEVRQVLAQTPEGADLVASLPQANWSDADSQAFGHRVLQRLATPLNHEEKRALFSPSSAADQAVLQAMLPPGQRSPWAPQALLCFQRVFQATFKIKMPDLSQRYTAMEQLHKLVNNSLGLMSLWSEQLAHSVAFIREWATYEHELDESQARGRLLAHRIAKRDGGAFARENLIGALSETLLVEREGRERRHDWGQAMATPMARPADVPPDPRPDNVVPLRRPGAR